MYDDLGVWNTQCDVTERNEYMQRLLDKIVVELEKSLSTKKENNYLVILGPQSQELMMGVIARCKRDLI